MWSDRARFRHRLKRAPLLRTDALLGFVPCASRRRSCVPSKQRRRPRSTQRSSSSTAGSEWVVDKVVGAVGVARRGILRLRARTDRNPGGCVGRRTAASGADQPAWSTEPSCHADQPAVQRRGYPRGAPALPAGSAPGRPTHGSAYRGDAPRCHRGGGHPRRVPVRLADVHVRRRVGAAPARSVAAPRQPAHRARATGPSRPAAGLVWALALGVGTVGGIYGIGGGSLLAPILMLAGFSAYEVAPATLASTFVTSVAGVATYQVLQLSHGGSIAPEWALGGCIGLGGFTGSYLGARLQRQLPETSIRRLLGLLACVIAARYLQVAATQRSAARPAHASTLTADLRCRFPCPGIAARPAAARPLSRLVEGARRVRTAALVHV